MSSFEPNQVRETTLFESSSHLLRYYLGGQRGLLMSVAVLVFLGLVISWQWLAALGIAPLLLSLLPCLAMCALGICWHKTEKDRNVYGSKSDSELTDKHLHHPTETLNETAETSSGRSRLD